MEDDKFRAQIIALQLSKMSKGMRGDEFAVYCLVNKHIWEGVPLRWWINRFDPQFKWLVKRTLRENFNRGRGVVVNWLPLRKSLLLSVNRDDPTYVRHLFDLQPQRD
jgi:hypothetical protein